MNQSLDILIAALTQNAELIKKAVKVTDWRYKSNERLILETGFPFLKRVEPSPIKGQLKLCYQNCFQALWKNPHLHYCEGYATHSEFPIPFAHAWLVNEALEVIDPTWRNEQFKNSVYFGVIFTREFIREVASEIKQYGIIENDYLRNNCLKREGFPDGALLNLPREN